MVCKKNCRPQDWIDSHCHLDALAFAADRGDVWRAAGEAGVRVAFVPAVSLANCADVAACCARFSRPEARLFPAWGIHPLFVMTAREEDLIGLARRIEAERPLAMGEIGLDGMARDVDFARQEFFFAAQLKLAREFDLPVLLHARHAVDATLKHLRRIRVRGGIAHAFNGSRQQAEAFLALGFRLGFGGAMTYPGSTRIRRLAHELPEEALALETDAPDIPPVWRRGQRNSPTELPAIARVLAELRAMPEATLAARLRENLQTIFPILRTVASLTI
ncbi:MAG: TatD family hydrolase [Zoogloeaceae bacterium]|nr:TatD family hydrolase [Zoogloeaceae bacterium]